MVKANNILLPNPKLGTNVIIYKKLYFTKSSLDGTLAIINKKPILNKFENARI